VFKCPVMWHFVIKIDERSDLCHNTIYTIKGRRMVITHDSDAVFVTLHDYSVKSKNEYDLLVENVKKETGACDMDVIVIKKEKIEEIGAAFNYLSTKGDKVVPRYLFNPAIFKKFQKKGNAANYGTAAKSRQLIEYTSLPRYTACKTKK